MKLRTTGKSVVEEVPYGMYVWQCPDGEILGDDDGNVMNVFCMKGDQESIKALTEAAAYYGFPEGKPVWWSGKRRINDEQFEEQVARAKAGLVPDPFDYGAIKDAEAVMRRDR